MSESTTEQPHNATPMMRQYQALKDQNPDTLLLYRMGDFYEMFNDDAKIASQVLGLTLTSRNHGGTDATPLAGFPYHALDRYANRLVRAGHKIAICEQTEDPKLAKGLVKRDVVEIITAGTATEDAFINEKTNNFIIAVKPTDTLRGVAICDLSTGEFFVEELTPIQFDEEMARLDPTEILLPHEGDNGLAAVLRESFKSIVISFTDGWKFEASEAASSLRNHFEVATLEAMGLDNACAATGAAGALLQYLKEQKKNDLKHITSLTKRSLSEYAELDPSTIRNLELLRPLQSEDVGGTLISVLDKTSTSMGARQLRRWITHPLKDIDAIESRLDCIEWLRTDMFSRSEIHLLLRNIADIERLIGRITFERANARDIVGLRRSLEAFPALIRILSTAQNAASTAVALSASLEGFESLTAKIALTIVEDPPLSIRDGGLIRKGISPELDELNDAAHNGKQWVASLQESERARTGIGSLKVGYNKVFGYYIEVSKTNLTSVPDNYIRKQTLVNGERFITEDLKTMESKILGAEERLSAIEHEIFSALRKEIAQSCAKIQKASEVIATIDCMISLARVAAEQNYVRPTLLKEADLFIRDGRHPVVEFMNPTEPFVPNNTSFITNDTQLLLITGPNMAGKSTYLRQNALIPLMAQIGSFVPAAEARVGIVDKFFTRVGASDRLARGQSTFLVEMIEVANILNNATDKSLVLLDEVGRGTSTFDGISIAWAVAEYLHEAPNRRARTLFATHYHELTELSLLFPRIKNYHIRVREWNDRIMFLRKIAEGSCDHSYGIQVARLAGVPKAVLLRAKEILANLENMELTPDHKPVLARHHTSKQETPSDGVQLNLLDAAYSEIIDQLKNIDINSIRPVDALMLLAQLKEKADSRM